MLATQKVLRAPSSWRSINRGGNLVVLGPRQQRQQSPAQYTSTSAKTKAQGSSSAQQEPQPAKSEQTDANDGSNSSSSRSSKADNDDDNGVVSIPGPSWLQTRVVRSFTYPFAAYGRAQTRRPYLVQVASSIVIYLLGDLSSQYYFGSDADSADEKRSSDDDKNNGNEDHSFFRDDYSPVRSIRAMIIGSLISIPSYHWFLYLSHHFNVPGSHVLSLVYKIAVNQAVFNPVFNSYFFGMQSLLSFEHGWPTWEELDPQVKLTAAWARIRETVPITFINAFKFWPAVTAFSFTFIAPRFRSVFAGCMAVIWQTYLGLVNLRAIRNEQDSTAGIN